MVTKNIDDIITIKLIPIKTNIKIKLNCPNMALVASSDVPPSIKKELSNSIEKFIKNTKVITEIK